MAVKNRRRTQFPNARVRTFGNPGFFKYMNSDQDQYRDLIDRPVLIIHGAGDRATDFNESKKLAEVLKHKTECRFVSLPKSNHMIFLGL